MAEPKHTVVNVEEVSDRIVGKRRGMARGTGLQETVNDLRRSFGHGFVPKGVYRFRTHEEADEWMLKMLVRHSRKS
jgi:hypothetical protein